MKRGASPVIIELIDREDIMSKLLIVVCVCAMMTACEYDVQADIRGTHFQSPPRPVVYPDKPYKPPVLVIPGDGMPCEGVVQPDGLCLVDYIL